MSDEEIHAEALAEFGSEEAVKAEAEAGRQRTMISAQEAVYRHTLDRIRWFASVKRPLDEITRADLLDDMDAIFGLALNALRYPVESTDGDPRGDAHPNHGAP